MKTLYNITLEIQNLTEEKYDMLLGLLENELIDYEQTDYEEFTIDERSEAEKYDDWLAEQADIAYEEEKLGLR